MSSTIKLLPCPFCNNADISIKNESPKDNSGGYFIECPGCGASTSLRFACGDDPTTPLAEQWNRRATSHCLHQIQEPAAAEQAGWHAFLHEGRAQAPQPDDMRDKVTLALGLSLTPKGAPAFAWSYLLDSIRELVKCEEELVLLKAGLEMTHPAPAAVAVPDAVRDAEKLLRAEAARLERIYNGYGNKWYGFSNEKAAHIEHLRVADTLAATPAADAQVVLPEPVAFLHTLHDKQYEKVWFTRSNESGGVPVFTEQQVRALLARVSAPAAQAVTAPTAQDSCCAWSVWWTHDKAKHTTMRQASIAAWDAAIAYVIEHAPPQAQTDAREAQLLAFAVSEIRRDEMTDSELLDAMEQKRIAVVPEYEGPWDAEIYNDEGKPNHRGSGSTPREAIRAAIAAAKEE